MKPFDLRATLPLALLLLTAPAAAQGAQMKSVVPYPAGTLPRAAALADIDRDGDLDVIVTSQSPAQVRVLVDSGGALSDGLEVTSCP